MAIRRICGRKSKFLHTCIQCGRKIGRIQDGKATKCQSCGTVYLVQFTENGNVIMTDKKYKHLFEKEKKDEPGKKHKKV